MIRFAHLACLSALSLAAACARMPGAPDAPDRSGAAADASAAPPEDIAEVVRAPRPRAGANTVDALDTTSDAQRAAARAGAGTGGERLGEVTASLGDPTDPGIWMRTALVSSRQSGRVEVAGTGQSTVVELIPLAGEGGAQLSLAAMRLLQVPLTELPDLVVYRQ